MTDVQSSYDNSPHSTPKKMNDNRNMDNGGGQNRPRKRKAPVNQTCNEGGSDHGQNERSKEQRFNGGSFMFRLTGAPAFNLEHQNLSAMTFTGRCRLFVANLPSNVTEDSLRAQFSEFGQVADIYIGKGNQFAFIKMDTRANAEAAKNALDGKVVEGRSLRVRLAAHAAAIKVTNLPPFVSNELLHLAFSSFGLVERAIVIGDDRGRSLNEGIVEFQRKSSAQAAIKKCQNEALLLSASPIPVVVTSLDARDEDEGVPDKNLQHNPEYIKEREIGPRFAERGTIEYEIANKWKQLFQIEAQRREAFDAEIKDMHDNFRAKMEYFKLEETTKQLREQIRQMESRTQQFNNDQESRRDYERQREDERRQQVNMLRAQEEQLIGGHPGSINSNADMNSLRNTEHELRQHALSLQHLIEKQEITYRQIGSDPSLPPNHQMDHNLYNQTNIQNPPGPGLMQSQVPPQQPPQMNPYGHSQPAPVYGQPPLMPHQLHPQHRQPPMQYGNGIHPQQPPPQQQQQPQYHQNLGNGQNQHNDSGGYGKRNRNRY